MSFSSLKLVCFSPTGTTKKILEGIAQGIGIEPVEHFSIKRVGKGVADGKGVGKRGRVYSWLN